jgi:hypothetical protein
MLYLCRLASSTSLGKTSVTIIGCSFLWRHFRVINNVVDSCLTDKKGLLVKVWKRKEGRKLLGLYVWGSSLVDSDSIIGSSRALSLFKNTKRWITIRQPIRRLGIRESGNRDHKKRMLRISQLCDTDHLISCLADLGGVSQFGLVLPEAYQLYHQAPSDWPVLT